MSEIPFGRWSSGDYAYVPTLRSGFQVVDISDPAQPRRVARLLTGNGLRGADISGGIAYVTDQGHGIHVIDMSDPTHPRRLGGNTAFGGSDVVVKDGRVYVAGGYLGLMVFDIFQTPLELSIARSPVAGRLTLSVSGPAGRKVRIQKSADLIAWRDRETVTLGDTPAVISGLDLSGGSSLFYRAVGSE